MPHLTFSNDLHVYFQVTLTPTNPHGAGGWEGPTSTCAIGGAALQGRANVPVPSKTNAWATTLTATVTLAWQAMTFLMMDLSPRRSIYQWWSFDSETPDRSQTPTSGGDTNWVPCAVPETVSASGSINGYMAPKGLVNLFIYTYLLERSLKLTFLFQTCLTMWSHSVRQTPPSSSRHSMQRPLVISASNSVQLQRVA